jgi:hypothetical protein
VGFRARVWAPGCLVGFSIGAPLTNFLEVDGIPVALRHRNHSRSPLDQPYKGGSCWRLGDLGDAPRPCAFISCNPGCVYRSRSALAGEGFVAGSCRMPFAAAKLEATQGSTSTREPAS